VGDAPTGTIREVALASLENGDYAALEAADRDAILIKLKSYAGRPDADRLSRVVMTKDGPEAAAAYTALRKVAGEALTESFDPAAIADARIWVGNLRKSHPDWFP